MPLIAAVLQSEILKLTDPNNAEFAGYPADTATAASNWSNAFRTYFFTLSIPPPPIGETAANIAQPLAVTAYINAVAAGENPLDPIVVQYSRAIATTTAATGLGVASEPIGDPPIAAAVAPFIASPTNDPSGPALAISTAVQVWALTGLFTPAVPPGSPPVPWS